MRETWYTDSKGRKIAVQLPDGAPDSDAMLGIRIGPPSLESLDLPEAVEVRLHNQLYARGIHTYAEALRRRRDIQSALMAALRVDTEMVVQAYNSHSEPQIEPTPASVEPVPKGG